MFVNGVTGLILLMYLNIFTLMKVAQLFIVHINSKNAFSGSLGVLQSRARFVWWKDIQPKMAVATRWTFLNFDIRVKGMAAQEDQTHYLTFLLNISIYVTCSFLYMQFNSMTRSSISVYSGLN